MAALTRCSTAYANNASRRSKGLASARRSTPSTPAKAAANEFTATHRHRAAIAASVRLSCDRRADRRRQDIARAASRATLVDAGIVRAARRQSLPRTLLSRHHALCVARAIAFRVATRAAGAGRERGATGRHAAHRRFHDAEERHLRASHAAGRRVAFVPRARRAPRSERAGAGLRRVFAGESRGAVLAHSEARGAYGIADFRRLSACALRRV